MFKYVGDIDTGHVLFSSPLLFPLMLWTQSLEGDYGLSNVHTLASRHSSVIEGCKFAATKSKAMNLGQVGICSSQYWPI